MRFVFIAEQKRLEESMTTTACRELQVSRSGYYAWQRRHATSAEPSARHKRHQELIEQVRLSFLRSRQRYGAPKITEDLKRRGIAVCLNTVAKIMRECDLAARRRRRFVPRTTDSSHNCRCAPNRVERRFTIEQINKIWLGDITYIPSEQGWLFLATLMDLCSRYIVGWAMSDRINAELTCSALNMAIEARRPEPGLICHSDRGSQYACRAYQQLLKKHGLLCSMSRRGNCYDNAPQESFFATLKGELEIDQFKTRDEAKGTIFEFIEVFYNRKRIHSALGYQSPESFEAAQAAVPKHAPAQSG
jgi:putative transposase